MSGKKNLVEKNRIHFELAKEFKETFLLKQYFRVHGMRKKKIRRHKVNGEEGEIVRRKKRKHRNIHDPIIMCIVSCFTCIYLRIWERCLLSYAVCVLSASDSSQVYEVGTHIMFVSYFVQNYVLVYSDATTHTHTHTPIPSKIHFNNAYQLNDSAIRLRCVRVWCVLFLSFRGVNPLEAHFFN